MFRNIIVDGSIDIAGCQLDAIRVERWSNVLIVQDFADDLRTGMVSVAEFNMQPGVTVDDVITTAARDCITAAAAEQDVATGEVYRTRKRIEVVGQTGNQANVGEVVERISLRVVGAEDEIIELRSAGGFRLDEEVAHGIANRRARIWNEFAAVHIDVDAVEFVFP